MGTFPSGVIPVKSRSTGEILYGDRVTDYRWEVLAHDSGSGMDTLVGELDGVVDGTESLTWTLTQSVKGTGNLKVSDLAEPKPGLLTVSDLQLESARIRPVCIIDGLPEIPLSLYLVSAAVEEWDGSDRVFALELLDRCTVLDQDSVEDSYAVAEGAVILQAVQAVVASAGEYLDIDATVTDTLKAAMVWPAGTSKLQIVNELLDTLGYTALWVDGDGDFQVTPYVVPAARDGDYELLELPRELVDGPTGIYDPAWTRDRDAFNVPNKVIAVESATGDAPALVGEYTNEDPDSPFSYQSRGRWIVKTVDGVDVPDGDEDTVIAFLVDRAQAELIAASSVQATVSVKHPPIPIRVSDVLRFANDPAGIDAKHVATSIQLEARPLGLMSTELSQVIDL